MLEDDVLKTLLKRTYLAPKERFRLFPADFNSNGEIAIIRKPKGRPAVETTGDQPRYATVKRPDHTSFSVQTVT